jgi:hypothetical protein
MAALPAFFQLVGKPLEGVRDADVKGAEALAVALEWHKQCRQ